MTDEPTTSDRQRVLREDTALRDMADLRRLCPDELRQAADDIRAEVHRVVEEVLKKRSRHAKEDLLLAEIGLHLESERRAARESPPGARGELRAGPDGHPSTVWWPEQIKRRLGWYSHGVQRRFVNIVERLEQLRGMGLDPQSATAEEVLVGLHDDEDTRSLDRCGSEHLDESNRWFLHVFGLQGMMVSLLQEDPVKQRTSAEWWRAAVLLALHLDPGFNAEALGLGGLVDWDGEPPLDAPARASYRDDPVGRAWLLAERAMDYLQQATGPPARPLSQCPDLGAEGGSTGSEDEVESSRDAVDAPPPICKHDPDFTWVIWYGKKFTFSPGNQAETVRHLWESWKRSGRQDGCGLSQEALRSRVHEEGARQQFRVDHLFRDHPALGTMIRKVGKGVWALYAPPSESSTVEPQ